MVEEQAFLCRTGLSSIHYPRSDSGVFFVAREVDRNYMLRALALAERGRGKVSPNPMVGAVIVSGKRIIAEGYHHRAGRDHAEIMALKKAGRKARGTTMYVNLEPCCHTGRTGPCTEALIAAGIKRLFVAALDPDPRVNGRGVRILRRAGIDLTRGLARSEAERLNESYYGFHRLGRPYIILKAAQSLDGRIATASGDSHWISGQRSLKLAHILRSEVDAVVVGMGTVRSDNPALTVRLVKGKNPYRIILTDSGRFPAKCQLLDNNRDGRTIIASGTRTIERLMKRRSNRQLTFWTIKQNGKGRLDLDDFVARAADFGIRSILVEGGAEVATSFLKARLVDRYISVVSPILLGQGINSIGDLGTNRLADCIRLKEMSLRAAGDDVIMSGYPQW